MVIEDASVNDAFWNRLVDIRYVSKSDKKICSLESTATSRMILMISQYGSLQHNCHRDGYCCMGWVQVHLDEVWFGVGSSYRLSHTKCQKTWVLRWRLCSSKAYLHAVEEVHCTGYEAVCTLHIMIRANHQLKYRINGKKSNYADWVLNSIEA